MSTVLEEKIPRIQHQLVERYGKVSQSAVNAVAEGIKTAVSTGIASSQDKLESFALSIPGVPDPDQLMLDPLIGTKISEAAGVPSPQQVFQREFLSSDRANQAELTSFANALSGENGLLKSLEAKGFIIQVKNGLQQKGIIINGSEIPNSSESGIIIHGAERSSDVNGFVIYGKTDPQSQVGIVGPEYQPIDSDLGSRVRSVLVMEDTLKKTLSLQNRLEKFNFPVKA